MVDGQMAVLCCRWEYDQKPQEGSPEAELLDACKNPRSWV